MKGDSTGSVGMDERESERALDLSICLSCSATWCIERGVGGEPMAPMTPGG